MRVATREIQIAGRGESIKITPIGDVHIGGIDCDKNLLDKCIDRIAEDENHYWIGMGDFGEFINYKDKRFDPAELDPEIELKDLAHLPRIQSDMIASRLARIKSKCLGLLCGNHEETIRLRHEQDIHTNLCSAVFDPDNRFGITSLLGYDLEYSAILRLRIARDKQKHGVRSLYIYAHHGAGGGRKTGGKINRLEDAALTFPDCDIYLMGHVHDKAAWLRPSLHIAKKSDRITQRFRAFGITGTFKKTYQQDCRGYGEKSMYPATALGVISFVVRAFPNDDGPIQIDIHNSTSGLPA